MQGAVSVITCYFVGTVGLYVIFLAVNLEYQDQGSQVVACLVPPLALQLVSCAFRNSYTGLPVGSIVGILVHIVS